MALCVRCCAACMYLRCVSVFSFVVIIRVLLIRVASAVGCSIGFAMLFLFVSFNRVCLCVSRVVCLFSLCCVCVYVFVVCPRFALCVLVYLIAFSALCLYRLGSFNGCV